MRTITTHHTNDANKALDVQADDRDPANGNTSHLYAIRVLPPGETVTLDNIKIVGIPFQHGPIGEVGINGITNEVLLAIVIDRIEGFQSSKWACEENARALTNVREALADLESRTKARQERGVEGTHEV